jgi:cyclic beta-1,2-glucan synthetase
VVAADVYAVAPHTGRGGWTWYTGSAGWMYRLLVEVLLGVKLEGDHLRLVPRLPMHWPTCKISYRYRQTFYHINISRQPDGSSGPAQITLDGNEIADGVIPLIDDLGEHRVEMRLGNP